MRPQIPDHPAGLLALSVCAAAALSGGCDDFRECASPNASVEMLPLKLSQTGLYADIARDELAPEVRPFTPSFALWSDGASKRRFIALPAGARIDTRDMDDWQFPIGTRLWKEFSRDGVRVETRLEQKIGSAAAEWALVAYLWNDTNDDATRLAEGANDAHGTEHDVPRAADCLACHGGRKSHVLGFSAIQLAHDADSPEDLVLSELVDSDLLSHAPSREPRVPGTDAQVQGLGYLHANCAHCHNQSRPNADGPRCYDPRKSFDFALRVGQLARIEDTAAYRTGVGEVIRPGSSSASEVVARMRVRDRDLPSMPPLATERVDAAGLKSVRALIDSLPH